ncbi:MAG: hypothetical protein A2Y34_05855 [Spirochaetes bacterium GWC1_27_15]|nr:MAG: hypothetical protein A2Z98_09185 [Spirochaetes bacterium GWB1_27_13]OHD24787.1 MAG: hypothetical protein A2Y34_05855 [Spirochaetes bacterium GWC1_27_15]
MKKFFYNFLVALLVIFSIVMCKTTDKNEDTTTTIEITTTTTVVVTTTTVKSNGVIDSKIDQRMVFVIDKDKITEDQLKSFMKNLFTAIEEKIAMGDFDGWYSSISKGYKFYINDPVILKKMSEDSDFLSNRNVKLKTPKDYFEYVVIQARQGKSLKFFDYKYIDKFNVKVICILDDSLKFVYNFIYEDGSWKLDR